MSILLMVFRLEKDRFAIPAREVVEVLPLLALTRIPGTPSYIAGAFNYRGSPVPAIDVSQLAFDRPCAERMSTRVIVVKVPTADSVTRPLGLIVERATHTIKKDSGDLVAATVTLKDVAWLGRVILDDDGMIQILEPSHMLPSGAYEMLARSANDVL